MFEQIELFAPDEYVLEPRKEKSYEEECLESIYREAQRFSRRHWGMEFDGEIRFERLKRNTSGSYVVNRCLILLNIRHLKKYGYHFMIDTLHHELVHWYLHGEHLPYDDTDYEFIRECLRLDISLSQAEDAQEAYQQYMKQTKRG